MRLRNSMMPLIAVVLFCSSLKANDEKIWKALRDGFVPWAVEMINANKAAVNYKFHPEGETHTIWSLLERFDLIRTSPNTVTWKEQEEFAEILSGDTTLEGLWAISVRSFDAQQVLDICKVCGPNAIESVFESGYIVQTNQNRMTRLKAKSWVKAFWPLR